MKTRQNLIPIIGISLLALVLISNIVTTLIDRASGPETMMSAGAMRPIVYVF